MAICVNFVSFELLTGCSFWLAEGWYGGMDEVKSVVCVKEKHLKLHKNEYTNTFQAAALTKNHSLYFSLYQIMVLSSIYQTYNLYLTVPDKPFASHSCPEFLLR